MTRPYDRWNPCPNPQCPICQGQVRPRTRLERFGATRLGRLIRAVLRFVWVRTGAALRALTPGGR